MTHDSGFILEMRGISKSFGGVQALRDVSFACRKGTVHALVGENGAGKSTLMKILAGAYQADTGEINYQGQRYTHFSTRQALDLGIRIIYQELNLIPYMDAAQNIFLGREPLGRLGLIDRRRMHEEAGQLLSRLGVELDLTAPVGEFTVATQQMIEIAKALSQQADLIVMDEPSAILAGEELERLFGIIRSLIAQGVSIVYISHRLDEIFNVADDVTVLKDGVVVGTQPIAAVDRPTIIHMMVGRALEEVFPARQDTAGAVVLEAENIATDASPHPFSLTLRAGEILGVAGMVGAGRTEMARAIFGADRLRTGQVRLRGQTTTVRTPKQAVEAGIALVPEDRKTQGLFMGLPIRSNITIPIVGQLVRRGVIHHAEEANRVKQAQRELSIVMASMNQEVQFLSGGNQQKVVLAKWLQTAPSVIILDEPTRGVDVGAKFEIYELIRQLTQRGVAILMISSELPELLGISDRIIVVRDGQIVGEFGHSEATEERLIALATTGRRLEEAAL
jgi:ribose transport system ATP-binding protein